MISTKQNDKNYVASTYARFDLEITRGKGSLVYDSEGREYIDLSSGIATNTFGMCDSEWTEAVTRQLSLFQHTSNLYYSEPCATLARMLSERTGAKKVFFSNSGAEANECAIKVARKWARENKPEGHNTIITLKNSFHGRTVTTLSATGQDTFHTDFHPFTEGFVYAEANNSQALVELVKSTPCCAIMVELVQGEGGVMALDGEFVDTVKALAREHELLIIVDEVQTGNGRCGSLYAYMQYGLTPDVVTTAKGLGGGLPIGATMMFDRVEGTLTPGSHGSTFGGNPVSCAAAISVLKRIDDTLLADVRRKSEYIKKALTGAKGIKSVSGLGLMLGIETERDAGEIIRECMELGVLPIKAKHKVRLLPALNIPDELLQRAIDVIKTVAAR
ncbi:MAG: acetylornithine/succinylornithine family transaminase [Clostridia bacterium]|nr:acetylornithine/succinylornithine family transaminase [Clostridia bacterium]